MRERNFNPRYKNDWRRGFGLPVRSEEEGSYGEVGAGPAVEGPTAARRRGIAGVVDFWNGMSTNDKVQTVATVAVLGVVGVEAAWIAKEVVGPGVQNIGDAVRTFVHNGTCDGTHRISGILMPREFVSTCGDTSLANLFFRTFGAINDMTVKPVTFLIEGFRDGKPSADTAAKTVLWLVEEKQWGIVRKTVGRAVVAGIRTLPAIAGAGRPPRIEPKG